MDDYRSNSHKSKQTEQVPITEKKVKKVIAGSVKSKKKNEIRKLADVFIPEDVSSVKAYILMDVIVPAIKKIISDTVDTLLYPGGIGRIKRKSTVGKTPYNVCYDKENGHRDYSSIRTRNGYDYDDIILDNRGEAEEVLTRMDELVATYGLVSVADLYDLVGISGNYTDNKYGWKDIRSAKVIRVRDGYMLKLPIAYPLN